MKLFLTLVLVMSLCGAEVLAHDSQTDAGKWSFALSAGVGKVTTPLSHRGDLYGSVLPAVSYYGERFYLESSFIGYSIFENQHWYIDLVGSLNEDGMFFELDGVNNFGWWDALGMQRTHNPDPSEGGVAYPGGGFEDIERRLSYMGGLSFTWLNDLADLRFTFLTDISGVHQGEEFHLTLRKNYSYKQWKWQWQLGTIHKDQQLNNYYYNLRPHELNNTPSWFSLPDSRQYFYGFTVSYQFNPQWAAQAFWQKNMLDQDLLRSPLLGSDRYYSRFIGVRYSF